ncbi:mitochondrial CoA-disulfide reductase [Andalucia godoyi]|uniref:Mitochondrial CoA-disulfide reductase n=1 Tax=Andalucia godoyi TaxID=505711 RepID=A0A8K0F2F6_ANDGO|nr:mitochondrial CoA-disulfide reductase [Andalucia godoyi]|eukprot:ANDGO_02488.mRNA.1 mitochondrial CoA-disulfide reductase
MIRTMVEPVKKVVIVGGVAGGASCAARLRRLSESASIVMLERGAYASFANCGLPYHISGEIDDRDDLLVVSPQVFRGRYNVDVRTNTECVSIDRAKKTVMCKSLADGSEFSLPYDTLVLATGASPFVPPNLASAVKEFPDKVFVLRNLSDMDAIQAKIAAAMTKNNGKCTAVIVGGGYIGIETAEAFARRGVKTVVVELLPQLLPPFDPEMVVPIEDELKKNGVEVKLGTSCSGIISHGDGIRVKLASGEEVEADFCLLSVGVRPESTLAKNASIETGPRGGIAVNDHMQTLTDPSVYAVGDVVEVKDGVMNVEHLQIPLAGPANRQGHIAASHMIQGETSVIPNDRTYRGTLGTAILRCFGRVIGSTGCSEKFLRGQLKMELHKDYEKVYGFFNSHAGYYPGAARLAIKMLFTKNGGRVLGAQVVGWGHEGVDKRVDVFAMALAGRMTVHDLEQAELAYAPPFGSAKDPVNQLGFMACGVLRGEQRHVFWDDDRILQRVQAGEVILLDVRSVSEWKRGHVDGAVHIPLEQLRDRLQELRDVVGDTKKPVVAYCAAGFRGYIAQRILDNSGFDTAKTSNLSGGFEAIAKLFRFAPKL